MSLIRRTTAAILGEPVSPPPHIPRDNIPQGVTFRRGRLVPWIGGVLARTRGPAAAVTLGNTIILRPDVQLSPQLLTHELVHVRQWRADPFFPLRYSLATLRHGYHNNPYEVEARLVASRHSSSMNG